jgi:hypothetical protein
MGCVEKMATYRKRLNCIITLIAQDIVVYT